MGTKRLLVMLLLAAAACDGAPERVAGPAEPSKPSTSTSSSCDPPTIISPANGVVLSGTGTKLVWYKDPVCAWVHRIEVLNSSGTVVWYDDSPEYWTFQIGNTYEYQNPQLGSLAPGRYYTWRVRSYFLNYNSTVGPVSPWSPGGSFAVRLSGRPNVWGSVESGRAKLTWSPLTGATAYQVYRYNSVTPWAGWEDQGTVTGTSLVDVNSAVSAYTGQSAPTNSAFLTYYVVGLGEGALRSEDSHWNHFATGLPPHEIDEPY